MIHLIHVVVLYHMQFNWQICAMHMTFYVGLKIKVEINSMTKE